MDPQHHHHQGYGEHSDDNKPIHLNIGGSHYTTSQGTLRAHRTSILCKIFTPPYAAHQDPRDGSFFLDRNGEVFGLILDYLRSGSLVVPKDPVKYALLRKEVCFYGLPVASQLPVLRPLMWEAAPCRYRHVRILVDEIDKQVAWDGGALPSDINQRSIPEITSYFSALGYKVVSEYLSRGTKGFHSIWMRKKELYPGADVAIEVGNSNNTHQQQQHYSPPATSTSQYDGAGMPSNFHNSPNPTAPSRQTMHTQQPQQPQHQHYQY